MRRVWPLALLLMVTGCATVAARAYYPHPAQPGIAIPGAGLLDFVANPLIVRAFTRDQEIAADLKAVKILRDMGYESPRRAMAEALRAAAKVNGPPRGGWLAAKPTLEDRLSRLEPLEAEKQAAQSRATSARRRAGGNPPRGASRASRTC